MKLVTKMRKFVERMENVESMTDAQVADIKAAQEKMMESAQKLFSKMYEQKQGGGQGNAAFHKTTSFFAVRQKRREKPASGKHRRREKPAAGKSGTTKEK